MDPDVKVQLNNQSNMKIPNYILGVIIIQYNNFNNYKKDLVYLQKHRKLYWQEIQQVDYQ